MERGAKAIEFFPFPSFLITASAFFLFYKMTIEFFILPSSLFPLPKVSAFFTFLPFYFFTFI